jgi:hypothetical protein
MLYLKSYTPQNISINKTIYSKNNRQEFIYLIQRENWNEVFVASDVNSVWA